MGFRSMLITEDIRIDAPEWFTCRYDFLNFYVQDGSKYFPISTKDEMKFYEEIDKTELFIDIQKLLKEQSIANLTAVLLHECGGITHITITQDSILSQETLGWKPVKEVEHSY